MFNLVVQPGCSNVVYGVEPADASGLTVTSAATAPQTAAMGVRKQSVFGAIAGRCRYWVRAAIAEAALWPRRVRTRGRLRALSGRDLKDIGLTENERRRESQKPFWLP